VSFEPAAARVIADLSRGVPRRINVLCDRSLQEGRIEGVNAISAELVKRAARALAGAHDPLPAAPAAPPKPAAPPRPTPPPEPARAAAAVTPVDPLPAASRPAVGIPASTPPGTLAAGALDREFLPEPAAPAQAPALIESASEMSGPIFGQAEVAAPRGWKTTVVVIAAGLVLAAAAGYAVYARSVPDPATVVPEVPPAAIKQVGAPAEALPVPSPEEIATMHEMFPPVRRVPVPPAEPSFPVDESPSAPEQRSGPVPVPANPFD
jgi:hypothetical protein